MSRVFTLIFSDAAFSNNLPASDHAVVIATGRKRVVRLKLGSEGRVTDLIVKQNESDLVKFAFSVELLKTKTLFSAFDADILAAEVASDTIDLYSVMPGQSAIAGGTVELYESFGFGYKNMDGTYTNNEPYLYLLIDPGVTTGTSNWKIAVTVEREVG